MENRICINCGSKTTNIRKNGWQRWYHYKDGYICHKCYTMDWRKKHPDKVKENYTKWNPLRPKYIYSRLMWTPTGKQIVLKENPRTGICSNCGKHGLTNIHHTEYHDGDPLKNAIELCPSCHAYESHRLGQIRKMAGSYF